MLRFRTALSVLALAGTTSIAAAQTVAAPTIPSDPVTTGTVTAPTGTTTVQTVYPAAPGPYGDSRGVAPDVPNPSVAPSGQNPAVDDGLPFTSDD